MSTPISKTFPYSEDGKYYIKSFDDGRKIEITEKQYKRIFDSLMQSEEEIEVNDELIKEISKNLNPEHKGKVMIVGNPLCNNWFYDLYHAK